MADTAVRGPDALRSVARKAAPAVGLALGVSLVNTLLALAIPIYLMQVYQRVAQSQSMSTLVWMTVLVICAVGLIALLDYFHHRIFDVLGNWAASRLGVEVVAGVSQNALNGGGNARQALRDVMDLRNFLTSATIVSCCELVWAPIFFIVLFMVHPIYGIVAVTGAVLLVGCGILNEIVTHRPVAVGQERVSRANSHVALALRNAETIEAMGLMSRVLRRWAVVNQAAQQALDVEYTRSAVIAALSRGLRFTLQIGMLITGAALVIHDRTAAGHIIIAMILVGRGVRPFEHLIDQWRVCLHASNSYRRLRDLLRGIQRTGEAGLAPPTGALEVEDLTFQPRGSQRPVVQNVSFRVEPGEAVVITGHSGAGKSTLARLIMGVFTPTKGRITLGGRDIREWRREELGRSLGYLPQNVGLFDVSVRDNIARLEPADPADVVAAARRADVHDMIGRLPFGYDTPVGDGSFVLTGGQRQRVGLARAFFGQPHLIVLDEADASLDQAGELALIESIHEAKKGGAIVLVVSHRRAVANVADKLLVMSGGTIEQFGAGPGAASETRAKVAPMLRLAGGEVATAEE